MSRLTRRRWRNAAYALIGAALATLAHTVATPAPETNLNHWGTLVAPVPGAAKLDQHRGCKVGAFGASPWLRPGQPRGGEWVERTLAALRSMGMPQDAAVEAVARMRQGTDAQPLAMGNTHGVATVSGRLYLPVWSTTFSKGERYGVCTPTRTDFANDYRQEFGVVYVVRGADGREWHVGEFLACGNVSLFTPALPGWAPWPGYPDGGGPGTGGAGRHDTPEPGTWALALLALVALYLTKRTTA